MRTILIGAAAIALAATGAVAQPDKGQGGGNGKGGGNPAAMANGGGKQDRGGPGPQAAKAERGNAKQGEQGNGNRAERGNDRGPAMQADKRNDRAVERQIERADRGNGAGNGNGNGKAIDRVNDNRDVRDVRVVRDVRPDVRGGREVRTVWIDDRNYRGIIDGCPPGLAKKNNGCTPPGLAKDRDWDYRQSYYQPAWWGYDRVGDGRYYYGDGYLYRMNDRGSVLGYIPLLGGALSVGNPWPSYYQPVDVPEYYVDYYNLGPDGGYRYADDVLYRVDPQTEAITSIAALLTGDRFAVGQPMPSGYDVYNVPYGYQDQYFDSADAQYRYADGYVYEVDPTTQLIQAAIQLLT